MRQNSAQRHGPSPQRASSTPLFGGSPCFRYGRCNRPISSSEKLFLVGDAVATGNELERLDFKDARIEIESAAKAVRHKKGASICRAVDLVKNGSAQAVVSAGHTGAAVVASVLKLRTLKGIDRPAIACLLPTRNKVFVLIDGGANPDSNPQNLVQFAIMGSVFSAHVLGYNNPSVALMSMILNPTPRFRHSSYESRNDPC